MFSARPDADRAVPQWTARANGTTQLVSTLCGPEQGSDDGDEPLRLDVREQALVWMLASGLTDASAALRLRVSPRTVTSMLRALMDRLGVDNRFQLGLALGLAERCGTGPRRWPGTGAHLDKAAGDS